MTPMRHLGSIRSLARYFVPIGLWGVRLRRRKVCCTSTCTGSQLAVHSVCGAFLISAPLDSAAVLSAVPTRAIEKKVDRTGGAHCSLETQVRSREIIKHQNTIYWRNMPTKPKQNCSYWERACIQEYCFMFELVVCCGKPHSDMHARNFAIVRTVLDGRQPLRLTHSSARSRNQPENTSQGTPWIGRRGSHRRRGQQLDRRSDTPDPNGHAHPLPGKSSPGRWHMHLSRLRSREVRTRLLHEGPHSSRLARVQRML